MPVNTKTRISWPEQKESQAIGESNQTTNPTEKKTTPQSFIPQDPKYNFDEIILPQKTMDEIMAALSIRDKSDLVFNTWGLKHTHKFSRRVGFNLYGPPGTGKTMVAHAIASYLG